jgi:hypothetical protein
MVIGHGWGGFGIHEWRPWGPNMYCKREMISCWPRGVKHQYEELKLFKIGNGATLKRDSSNSESLWTDCSMIIRRSNENMSIVIEMVSDNMDTIGDVRDIDQPTLHTARGISSRRIRYTFSANL